MYYFIVNPTAGDGKVIAVFNALKQYLTQKNILGECMKTASKDDVKNLSSIAQRKGYSTIIAVGGDGTVHEVLQSIAGSSVTLGVIPFGRDNMFAKNAGIPLQWKKAVDTLASRKVRKSAVGKILQNKTYFIHSLRFVRDGDKKPSLFMKPSLFHPHIEVDRSYTVSSLCHEVSIELGDYKDAFSCFIRHGKDASRFSVKQCNVSHIDHTTLLVDTKMYPWHKECSVTIAPFRQKILVG